MNVIRTRLLLQYSVIILNKKSLSQLFEINVSTVINPIQNFNRKSYSVKYHSTESYSEVDNSEFETECVAETHYVVDDDRAITNGNPEQVKLLKLRQQELNLMAATGKQIPARLKPQHWHTLLNIENEEKRISYLKCLWSLEIKKTGLQRRQKFKNEYIQSRNEQPVKVSSGGPIIYNLSYNTLFRRIYDMEMSTLGNLRLFQASMFESTIVIDMDYEESMTQRELTKCARQIIFAFSVNRESFNPSHLLFCNVNAESSITMSKLNKLIPNLYETNFPFTFTRKSYLDLFPKEKLVYLTPDCRTELRYFDTDTIYILGAIENIHKCVPNSMAKAKGEGLRMANFPINKYIKWNVAYKSIPLSKCIAIMNDLKTSNDWKYALRHLNYTGLNIMKERVGTKPNNAMRVSPESVRKQDRQNLVFDLLLKRK